MTYANLSKTQKVFDFNKILVLGVTGAVIYTLISIAL